MSQIVERVTVGDGTYGLLEINEYELPTVALVAGLDHAEASQYHRSMVDVLVEMMKAEGSFLALWAYQVIAKQQNDIDRLTKKLDAIESIVRENDQN